MRGGRKVTIQLLVPVRDWHGLLCLTWEPASCQPDEIRLRLISSEGSDYISLPVSFCLLMQFTVAHTQTVQVFTS